MELSELFFVNLFGSFHLLVEVTVFSQSVVRSQSVIPLKSTQIIGCVSEPWRKVKFSSLHGDESAAWPGGVTSGISSVEMVGWGGVELMHPLT